jgi:hypothetical protein
MNEAKLIANRWKTPDGTILHSMHQHDYVYHRDTNGKTYAVDGGNDYVRLIGNASELVDMCVYSDSPHAEICEVFFWTSYGIDGQSAPMKRPLKDLDTDHIQAIMSTQRKAEYIMKIFADELEFRSI